MIIRSITVENWRCIGRILIQDIPIGVVIIHGPNRSGKSSLFEAVQCCLFDYDHDTTSRVIQGVRPWGTKGTPKVVVDFEKGGTRYRITKVFSRGQDGTAHLERRLDEKWVMEVREPKEASRQVRELLGVNRTFEGLNQILWLEQGEVKLPDSDDISETLEKKLESVLGTLVTGRDLDFRSQLSERCKRWFTSSMNYRKGSPVKELRNHKDQYAQQLDEINERLRSLEGLVRQFEVTEVNVREDRERVAKAKEGVRELEKEKDACKERAEAHRRAKEALQEAEEREQNAKQAKGQYENTMVEFTKVSKELHEAEESYKRIKTQYDTYDAQRKEALSNAQKAREAEDTHAKGQPELKERQELLDICGSLAELGKTITEARKCGDEIARLDQLLANDDAPSEKEINELREIEDEIRTLRAKLEAGGIRFKVSSKKELALSVTVDTERPQAVKVSPENPREWLARQRIEADIPSVGAFEVGRGAEDLDIEDVARRLQELEREYLETIERWSEDPASPNALDRLAEKRICRAGRLTERTKIQNKFEELVPKGISALESRKDEFEKTRESIIDRRPQLGNWIPDRSSLNELNAIFEQERERLVEKRSEADERVSALSDKLGELQGKLSEAREEASQKRTDHASLEGKLASQGEPGKLESELTEANEERRKAAERLKETTLTESEKTVEERLKTPRGILEKQVGLLKSNEAKLNQCLGELRGAEGLHMESARVEQELNTITDNLEREELEAEAHKLLIESFDDCRESHVDLTMRPISNRVLSWAHHLGLNEYGEVSFAEGYFPGGFIRGDSLTAGQLVPLDGESYGTGEQLALLVRLALGNFLAQDETQVAILDDPLAHADPEKHGRMLDIIEWASKGAPDKEEGEKQLGRLQVFILTCHPGRFDYLSGATQIDFLKATSA